MNLFRSEEHVHNWALYVEGTEDGIIALPDLVKLFSGNFFRRRMDPDWVSRSREYASQWIASMKDIGKTGPFWQTKKP